MQPDQNTEYSSFAKIVIVEDEVSLADIYKTRLELLGYICFVAHDGIEAIGLIEKERPRYYVAEVSRRSNSKCYAYDRLGQGH